MSDTQESTARRRYSVEPERPGPSRRRRRRSRREPASPDLRGRLRLVFFSLAALWGFLIGTAAILFGLSLHDRRPDLGPAALTAMAVAVLLAIIGGIAASRAYREATRRR